MGHEALYNFRSFSLNSERIGKRQDQTLENLLWGHLWLTNLGRSGAQREIGNITYSTLKW